MVEWEPLIELKGNKAKKQYDQRKRFKDYADKAGSFHCSRRQGTIVTLCYLLAGLNLISFLFGYKNNSYTLLLYENIIRNLI